MAIIPTNKQTVQTAPLNPTLQQPINYRADDTVQKLGSALLKIEDNYQKSVARDYASKADDELREAFSGKDGILTKQGIEAKGITKKGLEKIEEVSKKYTNNPYFEESFRSIRKLYANNLSATESKELKKYNEDSQKALLELSVSAISGAENNFDALEFRQDKINEIEKLGKSQGKSDIVIATEKIDFSFDSDKKRLEVLNNSNDAMSARDYYNSIKGQYDKKRQQELETIVRDVEVWEKFIAGGGSRKAITSSEASELSPSRRRSIISFTNNNKKFGKIEDDKQQVAKDKEAIDRGESINFANRILEGKYSPKTAKELQERADKLDIEDIAETNLKGFRSDFRDYIFNGFKTNINGFYDVTDNFDKEITKFYIRNNRVPDEKELKEIRDRILINYTRSKINE